MGDALATAHRLLHDAYYEDRSSADVMHRDAATYAAIAAAEAATSQAHALERIAESLERALPMLGNIAGALTPDAAGRAVTVADSLKRIADAVNMDHNDLTILDGIYALVEAVTKASA